MSEVKKYEASAPKQFFTVEDWLYPGLLPELPYNDLLSGIVYTPSTIVNALKYAQHFLENVPGPNLDFRREHTNNWLGWWIESLSNNDMNTYQSSLQGFEQFLNFTHTDNVVDPNLFILRRKFSMNKLYFWPVCKLEGHDGHRYAMEQVVNATRDNNAFTVVVFDDQYLEYHDRKEGFLPTSLVMSMWSHLLNIINVDNVKLTTIPRQFRGKMIKYQSVESYYNSIFKCFNAYMSFYSEEDSIGVQIAKSSRGKKLIWDEDQDLLFQRIFKLDCPSTTDRVRI